MAGAVLRHAAPFYRVPHNSVNENRGMRRMKAGLGALAAALIVGSLALRDSQAIKDLEWRVLLRERLTRLLDRFAW
jgi:hypothetical protein